MDTHQLPGQEFSAVSSALISEAHGPRQQGHQQGRVIAVLRRCVHRGERGGGYVRVTEQTQDGRLAGEQALRVPNEEGFDEGPQDERAPATRATDVQSTHLRCPATAQPDDLIDVFGLGQALLHPGTRGVPAPTVSIRIAACGTYT